MPSSTQASPSVGSRGWNRLRQYSQPHILAPKGAKVVTLPGRASAVGRGDPEFPHFVGDADLAEGRLLHRKFNDPLRDLGRGPVRQDRLLAADLLQRQLAAFVIEILEAVEAIAAIAEHLAGLAHIAKLPGELQQAHLSLDNFLVLRHRWCPHKRPRPGSPQPWPAPRPPRLSLPPYDTQCRIKYQLVHLRKSSTEAVSEDASSSWRPFALRVFVPFP